MEKIDLGRAEADAKKLGDSPYTVNEQRCAEVILALTAEIWRLREKVNRQNEYLEIYNPDLFTEDEPALGAETC